MTLTSPQIVQEMIIDIPKAGEYLGFIISELIFARTIEFNFINDAPDEFKDSMKACNLIAQIVRGVQSHSDENTARETYRNRERRGPGCRPRRGHRRHRHGRRGGDAGGRDHRGPLSSG